MSAATLRHRPRLGVRRRESAFYFCNSILCQLLLYATIPVWASGVKKVLLIFLILFASVVTLRLHPRLGVRRRQSAAYFSNYIFVSVYFTPPSPFGRQS